ncbi:vWA domain-containing protein [Tunicatimonas pelagia]|uniref:vWA domain-containing protein n=1 Tax=Tunicatimonas pelagia TaxID=931531 RepID=UPI00266710D0|nr:VWA domain-containing protein [Tunicatimonas pelagia]WKN43563.1 VWA domain-containing protein [Tunicatimonas pelagia]
MKKNRLNKLITNTCSKKWLTSPCFIILLFALVVIGFPNPVAAQMQVQRPPEKTRMLFLLDASGSMFAEWGNSLRMDVAKNMLIDLVDSLRVDNKLELALRVYGHQFHRRYQNCEDTKLEIGFAQGNHNRIIGKLRQIQPAGVTPIAYSLEQAARDFPMDPDYRNVVIILTDGIESCGGDPCAVSLALQERQIFLKPFVIGLGIKENFEKEFACVGQYFDAKNQQEFRQVLNKILKQSLETTTVSVELLDQDKRPTETNVNVTFINNFTKAALYDFVHFRDPRGRPDSVIVDAVLSYDVVVNTIPPVARRNVTFEGGQHNVVSIQAPQGTLTLKQPGHSEYAQGVNVLVRKAGSPAIINVQPFSQTEKYLVGKYDLEVLTLPKTYFRNVSIAQSETTELSLPGPGLLNVNFVKQGIGSLYQLNKQGQQRWIMDFDNNQTRITTAIQPGKYKLVFRAKDAFGSKYTEAKDFSIKTGSTANIKFF